MDKAKSTRGRPRLNIELDSIVEVVFRHGQITAAARELGCSPGYIHAALRNAGLALQDILGVDTRDLITTNENGKETEE